MAKRVTRRLGHGRLDGVGRARRLVAACAFGLLSAAFALLPAACAPASLGTSGNDPLLGVGPPAPPPSGALAGGPGPAQATVPPLPTPSGVSPAALAASTRPLDPSRPSPRIGDGAADADTAVWRGQGSPGVTLQQPQPVAGGDAAQMQPASGTAPVMQPAGNVKGGGPGFDELQAQMRERGVAWQSLNTTNENGSEWKYSCAVPLKQNPNTRKAYEAKGSDPAAAMRKVLEAIDKDR